MRRARIVGVDYGRARVGIALSDPLGMFAQPVGTFSPADALEQIERIRAREGVRLVVLGWPIGLDGSTGPATDDVAAYETRLRKSFPGLEIVRWDERLSSREAGRVVADSGIKRSRRRQKGNIDTVAAAIILQSYLDANQ
jgi:putative Holliday junction resolvase